IGLSNFSYADYVILSATLSYAIAEELNDEDLDLFIIFLGQITSDLALLRTKRGYDLKRKLAQNQQDQEGIYDTLVAEQGAEDISIVGLRRKKKRYRKTKKEKKA
ncbi:MAG: hypothetical protein ACRCX2_31120, partial [Paraclostridium sp.]